MNVQTMPVPDPCRNCGQITDDMQICCTTRHRKYLCAKCRQQIHGEVGA